MRDQLKALQILVYTGVAGAGLAIAFGLADLAIAAPIHTTVLTDTEIALPTGVKTAEVSEIGVIIADPTAHQRLLYALTQAPTALLVLGALLILARLLQRARRSDPFTLDTVRALHWLGACLMAGMLAVAIESGAQFLLSETLSPDRFGARFEIPYLWVLGGSICLALAAIVRRAVAMRDELETLV